MAGLLLWVVFGMAPVVAQVVLTPVGDTVYHADGTAAAGTVLISWPSFTTTGGQTVSKGSTSVTLGAGGSLSVSLAANAGGTPMGTYYTVVYHLDDGTVSREYWTIPVSTLPVKLTAVRASVLPTSVAMQTVTKQYVDQAIQRATLPGATTEGLATYLASGGASASLNTVQYAGLSNSVSNPGAAATQWIVKDASKYGLNVIDQTGSTTPLFPLVDGELYNVTGAVTGSRAVYRAHVDASNATSSQHQVAGFVSGAHAGNSDAFQCLADGLASSCLYGFLDGAYGIYLNVGEPAYTVTAVNSNGGNCQFTTSAANNFAAGASVTLAGIVGATACNGTYTVVAVNNGANQVTVNKTFAGTYTSGGTALHNVATVPWRTAHYSTGNVFEVFQLGANTPDIFHVEAGFDGAHGCTNFFNLINLGATRSVWTAPAR
jgi:hypothetical protein